MNSIGTLRACQGLPLCNLHLISPMTTCSTLLGKVHTARVGFLKPASLAAAAAVRADQGMTVRRQNVFQPEGTVSKVRTGVICCSQRVLHQLLVLLLHFLLFKLVAVLLPALGSSLCIQEGSACIARVQTWTFRQPL